MAEYIRTIDGPTDPELLASGKNYHGGLTVDDPVTGHQARNEDGVLLVKDIEFTQAEEDAWDVEHAQWASDDANYLANEKYKDDRSKAYGPVEDQLDMIYWDLVNGTTTWRDHVAAVKAAHPKPMTQ